MIDDEPISINTMMADMTQAVVDLETYCAEKDYSFPDVLRSILEQAWAASVDGLVRTRPGSWEASHIRALAEAATWEDEFV